MSPIREDTEDNNNRCSDQLAGLSRSSLSATSKWGVCLWLFLATTLNYLDRQTLGILAPFLQKEMHFDNEALGWLFSVFYYSYTFSQIAVGPILDRANLRWAYGGAVVAWSLVAALPGWSTGLAGLLIFRLLLGVMESPNWPAALRIVARALPANERALGSGIFTSGTSVGALIAPGLVLGIASAFGWRWGFILVAALGVAWFLGWIVFTGRRELSPVWIEQEPGPDGRSTGQSAAYKSLIRNQQFWRVLIVAILVNPCLYFSVNWLPTYFAQDRGLTPGAEMGWILTAVYIGLDLGNIAGGGAVLLLTRNGWPVETARRMVFLCATALAMLCAFVPSVQSLGATVTLLVMANFGLGMWIAIYLTMAQEVSRTQISTAAGVLGGSGSLVGGLAMWAVGKVTRETHLFSIPLIAVAVAIALAALAGWAASAERIDEEQVVIAT